MVTFFLILALFLRRMRRNANFRASGYNSDNDAGFSDPDFLHEREISAIGKHLGLRPFWAFFFARAQKWHYLYFRSEIYRQRISASETEAHCSAWDSYVTEYQVFRLLRLRTTATGLDQLPAWFLILGAALFAAPVDQLFNQSISEGVVPSQWKRAIITSIRKCANPSTSSEYRPISITSVLSRTIERQIVREYIYPALQTPMPYLHFMDQFAFRPSGQL